MKGWWYLNPKVFTPAECAELVAYGMTKNPVVATVGHGSSSEVRPIRTSTVRWLDSAAVELKPLVSRLEKLFFEANVKMFGFDYHSFHELQFTEYLASNAGHYDWHEDNCWVPNAATADVFDRKLSLVVQLSAPESYAGGRLELERDNLKDTQFVNQGDVIIFPSFLRHRVTPVTSGVRYSLVSWVKGPRFK